MKRFTAAVLHALVAILVCGCGLTPRQRAQLKEDLRQEILAELRSQQPEQEAAAPSSVRARPTPSSRERIAAQQFAATPKSKPRTAEPERVFATRSDLRRMLKEELKDIAKLDDGKDFANPNSLHWLKTKRNRSATTGTVEGQVLRGGKGLPGCRVKLVQMVRSWSVVGYKSGFYEGDELVATTNKDGKYRFEHVPVGEYKLKWLPPGAKWWMRRLWLKPDAVVKKGESTALKPLETRGRLASG